MWLGVRGDRVTAPAQVGPSSLSGGPTPSTPAVRTYQRRALTDPRTYITSRERQVIVLAANGNTNAAIARALEVNVETVKSRWQSILRKLRVADRTQAVAVALCIGLLKMGEVEIPAGANRGYRAPE